MTRTILFYLLLSVSNYSFAQMKTGPGYYVTNSKDTISGYIGYRNNYNSEFEFRSTPNAKSKTITSNEALGFSFLNSRVFKTINVASELTSTPVFAQVLINGDIDVYEYQGYSFVENGKGNIIRLETAKPKPNDDAKKNYQKNVGYLTILFQDCPEVLSKVRKVGISSNRLIAWVEEYHTINR